VDNKGNQNVLHFSDFENSEPALLQAIKYKIILQSDKLSLKPKYRTLKLEDVAQAILEGSMVVEPYPVPFPHSCH